MKLCDACGKEQEELAVFERDLTIKKVLDLPLFGRVLYNAANKRNIKLELCPKCVIMLSNHLSNSFYDFHNYCKHGVFCKEYQQIKRINETR